jgi:flagellar hook-associated protein 2
MPALTSLGIGSGIDINSMLTQLVALERRPLEQMQADAGRLQTKISSFGKIQSLTSALQDAANKLTGTALWSRSVAQSANEQVVVSVGGSSAAAGSYSVAVTSLASAQTLSSDTAFAGAGELIGAGTLTLELGTWSALAAGFTPKAGTSAATLEVTAADTVQTLRDKINALNAGVTASLVNDASGTRLALRSATTGAENGFRITAADADGNPADAAGLSRIAFDPPGGATAMRYSQAAANAAATVNGISVNSATNELTGVIDGLTLRLRGTSATPVDIDVSPDREAITEAVKGLAGAYSELARYIGEQTRYDATTRVGGPLQGDSAVGTVIARLRNVVNQPSAGSTVFARLSDIGLELGRDGALSVDAGRLEQALANLPELKKAFTHSGTALGAADGFARRYAAAATELLAVDGSITTRTAGLRKLVQENTEKQQRLEDRVERYRERLVRQFTAMDSNLAKLNALNSYVTQQLAALTLSNSQN